MTTLLGVRKLLFAAPLLAAAAAWSMSSIPTEAATPATADVTASAIEATAEASAEALETVAVAASNCTYYSNASRTTVVGQFGFDCCNNPVAWGKKTKFSVCGGCFPCVPPPR